MTEGRRWTGVGDIAEINVIVLTEEGSGTEDGVNRVEFDISNNGVAITTSTTSTMEECFSNHSETVSFIPGAAPGYSASFPGYRIQLALNSFGGLNGFGTITIAARVVANNGAVTPLPYSLTLHNDTDGGDRRPTSKIVWVDPVSGNDSNPGTEVSPLLNIQKAFSGEMGGATVKLKAGFHTWGSPSGTFSQWQCSSKHWATIEWLAGATAGRVSEDGASHFYTGTNPGTEHHIRCLRPYFIGLGGVVNNVAFSLPLRVWMDGGIRSSAAYLPSRPWSVRYLEDEEKIMKIATPGTNTRMIATNTIWLGVGNGPSEFNSCQDVVVSNFIAIAFETNFNDSVLVNCLAQGQRAYRDLVGRIHGPVTGCVISTQANGAHAGKMVVTQVGALAFANEGDNQPMSLSTLVDIVGNTKFHVECVAFPGGLTGVFQVLEVGLNGSSQPYAILDTTSFTTGTCGASAEMFTWNLDVTPQIHSQATDIAHPDLLFLANNGTNNQFGSFYYGVCARDLDNAQTFFSSGTSLTDCVFWNCRDGNNKTLNMNFGGGSKTRVLFFNNTIGGALQMGGTQTNNQIRNNVFGSASGITVSGNIVDSNHFVTGSTFGTNASSGAWFNAASILVDPWSYEPTSGNLNTGSATCPDPTWIRWDTATTITRGCFRDAGFLDWAAPRGSTDIDASFAATVPVVISSVGALGETAAFTSTIPVTMTATGAGGLAGLFINTIPMTFSATGESGSAPNLTLFGWAQQYSEVVRRNKRSKRT